MNATEFDVYLEDDIRISPWLKVNVGLHASAFAVRSKFYSSLQPRLSARYLLNDQFSVNASFAQATFSYVLKTKAVPGREYKIRGFVPGLKEVSAVTTVPEVIPVVDKKYSPGSRTFIIGGRPVKVNELCISFRDPASSGGFYIIRIARDTAAPSYMVYTLDPGIDSRPQNIDEPGKIPVYNGDGICLNDKLFSGDTKTISLVIIRDVKDKYIELLHVNEDFYKFFLGRSFADETRRNPFAEPINTPGNIQNGLGVFGGVAKYRVKIGD